MRDSLKRGDRLNVWMNSRHVGVFAALKNGVGFEYDPDAPRISFSLPKDGSWRKDAPENFLLNLLPESGAANIYPSRYGFSPVHASISCKNIFSEPLLNTAGDV